MIIHISHYPGSQLAAEAKPLIEKLDVDRVIFADDDAQEMRELVFEIENGDEPAKAVKAKKVVFDYYKELMKKTDDNQTTVIFGPFYYNGKICSLEKNKKVILRIFLTEDFLEYTKNYYTHIATAIRKNPKYIEEVYRREHPGVYGTDELFNIYTEFKGLHEAGCYTSMPITGLKSFIKKSDQYKIIQEEKAKAEEEAKLEKEREAEEKKEKLKQEKLKKIEKLEKSKKTEKVEKSEKPKKEKK